MPGLPQYMHTSRRLFNSFKLYLILKHISQNWARCAFNCDFRMKLKMEKVWNKMPIKLRYVEISSKPWSHGLYGGSLIDSNIYNQSVKERAGLGTIFYLNEPIMYQWCFWFDSSWSGIYHANECTVRPIRSTAFRVNHFKWPIPRSFAHRHHTFPRWSFLHWNTE